MERNTEELIDRFVRALPDEALDELDAMLDGNINEEQIRSLLARYNVDADKIMKGDEA